MTGVVSGDGSLVLKAYLSRNTYTVTTVADSGSQVYTFYYGQQTGQITATAPEGYRFAGWQPQIPATMQQTDTQTEKTSRDMEKLGDEGGKAAEKIWLLALWRI